MLPALLNPTTYYKPDYMHTELNCVACGKTDVMERLVAYPMEHTVNGERPRCVAFFCSLRCLVRFWPPLGRA